MNSNRSSTHAMMLDTPSASITPTEMHMKYAGASKLQVPLLFENTESLKERIYNPFLADDDLEILEMNLKARDFIIEQLFVEIESLKKYRPMYSFVPTPMTEMLQCANSKISCHTDQNLYNSHIGNELKEDIPCRSSTSQCSSQMQAVKPVHGSHVLNCNKAPFSSAAMHKSFDAQKPVTYNEERRFITLSASGHHENIDYLQHTDNTLQKFVKSDTDSVNKFKLPILSQSLIRMYHTELLKVSMNGQDKAILSSEEKCIADTLMKVIRIFSSTLKLLETKKTGQMASQINRSFTRPQGSTILREFRNNSFIPLPQVRYNAYSPISSTSSSSITTENKAAKFLNLPHQSWHNSDALFPIGSKNPNIRADDAAPSQRAVTIGLK